MVAGELSGSDQESLHVAIEAGEGSGSLLLYEVFLQFRDLKSVQTSIGKKNLLVHLGFGDG